MTAVIDFTSYEESVPALLHLIQTETSLPQTGTIVIKPNLINDSPPPAAGPWWTLSAAYPRPGW